MRDGLKRIMASGLSRRAFLGGLGALAVSPALAKGDHPSLAYMKSVAKDLLHAHRQGTVSSFMRAIQRHADVTDIGN